MRAVVFLLVSLLATPALGYEINTGQGGELHWDSTRDYADSDGRISFWMQYQGSEDVSFLWESAVRRGFQAWADAPGADLHLFEQRIQTGPAAFHDATEDATDKQATLFFVDEGWEFEESVIGLTITTFVSGGRIIDSDIGFNADLFAFTLGDEDVDTDFQTIATHEIGHFFGIGHSEFDDATMAEFYGGGTDGRVLHEDDIAAIEHQYPCGETCRSLVDWRAQDTGCAVAGGGAWMGFGALLLLGGLLLRRRQARGAVVALLLIGLSLPMSADSTVVERLAFDRLVDVSERVVRAEVVDVEAIYRGHVWSRITLEVHEDLRGSGPRTVVLEQPGGLLDEPGPGGVIGSLALGMPSFVPGEETVLFLRANRVTGATWVTGLGQGKATLRDGRLKRDLSGLMLANMGRPVAPGIVAMPGDLASLRAALSAPGAPSP